MANREVVLINACKAGDLAVVKDVLTKDVNPTVTDNLPLRNAIFGRHLEIVKALLADPRVDPSSYRNEPLRAALSNGCDDIAKAILEDPRVDPTQGGLLTACNTGRVEMVRLMLADARVDPSQDNNRCLCKSIHHPEVVKLLLEDPRVLAKDHGPALANAIYDRYFDTVNLLLQVPTLNVTPRELEILFKSMFLSNQVINETLFRKKMDSVKLFLKMPTFNVSCYNNYAMHKACQLHDADLATLIMQHPKFDVNVDSNHMMVDVCAAGYGSVLMFLVEKGVDPTFAENQVLGTACEYGHVDIVKLLLGDSRVDPSTRANYALKIACERGHIDIVKLLLGDPRVDPSAPTKYQATFANAHEYLAAVQKPEEPERKRKKVEVPMPTKSCIEAIADGVKKLLT